MGAWLSRKRSRPRPYVAVVAWPRVLGVVHVNEDIGETKRVLLIPVCDTHASVGWAAAFLC